MSASDGAPPGAGNADLHRDADGGGGAVGSAEAAAEEAVPPTVATWTVAQVADWMREESQVDGAEEIAEKLAEEEVDGDMLTAYATMKQVKEDLGLSSGKANKVWKAMRALIDPLIEPAASPSAGDMTPVQQQQQQQVPPSPSTEREEHFVVRATGKIMSKTELFDQEIPKSQCWTLAEYATRSRERISQASEGAATQQTLLIGAMSDIEKELAALEVSTADAEAAIQNATIRHAQSLEAKIDEAFELKKTSVQSSLEKDLAATKEALEAQRDGLLAQQDARDRICIAGTSVASDSDIEVVEAALSLSGDIEVSVAPDALA